MEKALQALQRDVPRIAAAGRTDAGVHATAQVAHCDMAQPWDPFRLSEALNYHLKPAPVAITACASVADDWHARFSAIERRYLYRIITRRAPLVHDRGQAWHLKHPLDPAAMQRAADHLVGAHDFTTFRSSICQAKSPLKTLEALSVDAKAHPCGTEIRLHVRARSFLHNQVRSFAGTLERVGAGSWTPDRVATALAARDRAACGPVAPPHGLYLVGVGYPDDPFSTA